jgi:hypothetical protein
MGTPRIHGTTVSTRIPRFARCFASGCLAHSLGGPARHLGAPKLIARLDIGNNAMSNIWFSSEVAGTIMVQCIPVLRPFLREVHNSLTSQKLGDSENGRMSTTFRGSSYSYRISSKRASGATNAGKREFIELSSVPEDGELDVEKGLHRGHQYTPSEIDRAIRAGRTAPLTSNPPDPWPLPSDSDDDMDRRLPIQGTPPRHSRI